MKKRWMSLYVENEVGVLARVSGLFSGKSYNLHSLTVGETQDPTISRMTICVDSDDATFEQIKKQLNQFVEVIKVVDLTNVLIHMKEILYLKILTANEKEKTQVYRISDVFGAKIVDIGRSSILIECIQTEARNNELVQLAAKEFTNIEVVRGGSVAIESISISDR
ncbi:acetolactate synthase small subunit [Lachnotalea glycerini]|jgi:acetolactate synthase I/III small subunit|uniref:Acetolactate synthase small subunit n=1 Tax=Lachnotalea glycerini TaxID=1763509 RepID=A0A255IB36_9FIRM|nr:acetolactate synthase small subunit [Lachnotalea glycerini]PXV90286.1 acetolactate synthase small subunit [Lachnotalea glycerini]RDY31039.1 acetolactate synthase small subunit [Lachnotalea glycerini]